MANLAFKTLKMLTHAHDLRVMMALLEKVGYGNKIIVHQTHMAEDLGMKPPHVSSAIKRLLEIGVILKLEKEGINCCYELNPEFGWKGSAKNHRAAQTKYRKGQEKLAKDLVEELAPLQASTGKGG